MNITPRATGLVWIVFGFMQHSWSPEDSETLLKCVKTQNSQHRFSYLTGKRKTSQDWFVKEREQSESSHLRAAWPCLCHWVSVGLGKAPRVRTELLICVSVTEWKPFTRVMWTQLGLCCHYKDGIKRMFRGSQSSTWSPSSSQQIVPHW